MAPVQHDLVQYHTRELQAEAAEARLARRVTAARRWERKAHQAVSRAGRAAVRLAAARP